MHQCHRHVGALLLPHIGCLRLRSFLIPQQSNQISKQITEKEKSLWEFVLSAYGDAEFSTKQLEKDFGNAAYATIRSFVLKFEKPGLLQSARYGNRVKYAARMRQESRGVGIRQHLCFYL